MAALVGGVWCKFGGATKPLGMCQASSRSGFMGRCCFPLLITVPKKEVMAIFDWVTPNRDQFSLAAGSESGVERP